jgi:hypothetical protein
VGDNGRKRFTHKEFVAILLDLYDNNWATQIKEKDSG